jgi:hypothetical protein
MHLWMWLHRRFLKPGEMGRKGKDLIAKILDHFLISENLVLNSWGISSGVSKGGFSDYMPIFLKIVKPDKAKSFPLKFNDSWLQKRSFTL